MHAPEELEGEVKYSQVCAPAVWALLLGLASPLAFVGPPFYLFPVAAVGMSLLALGKIRTAAGGLSGTLLARLAIGLALGCMAAALVSNSVRDELLTQQSSETAQRWIRLLAEGRIDRARALLSVEGASGLAPPPSPEQPPQSAEDREAIVLERLRSDPVTLAVAGQKRFTEESTLPPVFEGVRTQTGCTLAIGDEAGAGRRVVVQLVRSPGYEAQGEPWRIERWSLTSAGAAGSKSP